MHPYENLILRFNAFNSDEAIMEIIKAIIALTGFIFLASLSNVFACHQGIGDWEKGHISDKYPKSRYKPKSGLGYTLYPASTTTDATTDVTMNGPTVTTDQSATTTDCNWRTANIEKFFNESYLQIAEESSQGQGPHLEALAFQVGCNAQQTVLLEKAMQQNYHDVFAKEDINHSINGFYTVVNSNDQLAACWPKS